MAELAAGLDVATTAPHHRYGVDDGSHRPELASIAHPHRRVER
jgi:hypothetical protein